MGISGEEARSIGKVAGAHTYNVCHCQAAVDRKIIVAEGENPEKTFEEEIKDAAWYYAQDACKTVAGGFKSYEEAKNSEAYFDPPVTNCPVIAYEFAINVGKAMREFHLAEKGELGAPGIPLQLSIWGLDELEKCIPIPSHIVSHIKRKMELAKERVSKREYSLGRLALEDANDQLQTFFNVLKGEEARGHSNPSRQYVTIEDPGKTTFKPGEIISKEAFDKENERVRKLGEKPATAKSPEIK